MSVPALVKTEVKCYCGRPLHHTGRHIGFKVKKIDGALSEKKRIDLVPHLESEVVAVQADIGRLKREIRDRQNALLDAEVKLKPLVALLEAYQNKRITGPAEQTQMNVVAVVPTQMNVVAVVPTPITPQYPVASLASDTDNEDDFAPIEADFNQIKRWADVRALNFRSWDDLRTINQHREKFELPPFKKKFGLRSG